MFYMKQTIGNACGTIGLLHAAANNRDALGIGAPGTALAAVGCGTACWRCTHAAPPACSSTRASRALCPPPPSPPLPAAEGSFLQQFLGTTEGMSPAERGAYLEQPPEGAPDIDSIHQVGTNKAVQCSCSAAPVLLLATAAAARIPLPSQKPMPAQPANVSARLGLLCRRRRSRGTRRRPALRRRWTCTS